MNVTQGDGAGEDGICVLWMSIPAVERRGRNKQMMEKKLTLSTQRLIFSKENIRNVKHNDMFTYLSVIQIFRLRLGPDVHQIPSNPRGMVWPNLPQSMWPRLESRGKKRNVCLRLCVLCISSCQMWTLSTAAHFKWHTLLLWPKATIWGKRCHMKYIKKVNCSNIFSYSLAQKALG